MNIILNPETDPQWDQVGRVDDDFRSQWGGLYIHFYSTVLPQESEEGTELLIQECCRKVAQEIMIRKDEFSQSDRFQIVIGWPKSIRESSRQIVKTGGVWKDVELLANGQLEVRFYPGWSKGIF